ncbi:MAG: HAD-IIA family hydrolase [Thaumarchaeota archaeon]|nr:HAD-IIA family hydrolase [Nitrososphaerota archaeon]
MKRRLLEHKKLFLFDLDGVFYKGKENTVKIGGSRAVEAVRDRGKLLYVLTNNSTDSTETIYERLSRFGIGVRMDEVLSSARLTAEFILQKHGRVSYFLVGEEGLESEMKRCGHRRSMGDNAKVVVVGLDRNVTYEKLDQAARIARNGAPLVATHAARFYMYNDGPRMATGPLVRAIEYASNKKATVIGKPSPLMFRIALRRARCKREDAVMIGDQVETDILGASRAGIDSILVTTGVDSDDRGMGALATIPNVDYITRLV